MMKKILFLLLFIAVSVAAAPPSGVVTTVAGQPGVAGYWDGPSADAMFTHPTWLDVVVGATDPHLCDEGNTGEIFVVDRINGLVRRISETGFVTTVDIVRRAPVGGPIVAKVPLDFDSAFGGGISRRHTRCHQPGASATCSRGAADSAGRIMPVLTIPASHRFRVVTTTG